jgi:hypothetical protein
MRRSPFAAIVRVYIMKSGTSVGENIDRGRCKMTLEEDIRRASRLAWLDAMINQLRGGKDLTGDQWVALIAILRETGYLTLAYDATVRGLFFASVQSILLQTIEKIRHEMLR